MNSREIQRVTLPSLPNPNELDQKKFNRDIISSLQLLFKRDEDKEKRLRKKEEVGVIPFVRDLVLVTAAYTVTSFYNDKIVVCNSALAMPVYFPTAFGSGKMLVIKNFGAGTVTTIANGTDTIDNDPTQDVFTDEGIIFLDYAIGTWLVS